jgi:predicted nucleic acid-binding protein
MAFVLDASVTACWAFDDEDHPQARLAFQRIRTEEAVVPAFWWFEVRNILIANERRHRIAEPATLRFLSALGRLPVRQDHRRDEAAVLRLARAYRLSVYAAAYVELAERKELALATLDPRLQKAAAEAKIALLGPGNPEVAG